MQDATRGGHVVIGHAWVRPARSVGEPPQARYQRRTRMAQCYSRPRSSVILDFPLAIIGALTI